MKAVGPDNRKNTNEKSIIYYIIVNNNLQYKILESKTDDNQ
jgi:hypothetical protein